MSFSENEFFDTLKKFQKDISKVSEKDSKSITRKDYEISYVPLSKSKSIVLENSLSFRDLLKIENIMKLNISKIVEELTKLQMNNQIDLISFSDLVDITYKPVIYPIFRASIQSAYQIGMNYTNTANNSNSFFTSKDIDTIKNLTDKYVFTFLNIFKRYFQRNIDIEKQNNSKTFLNKILNAITEKKKISLTINHDDLDLSFIDRSKLKPFNLLGQLKNSLQTMIWDSYNTAIIIKSAQLLNIEENVLSQASTKEDERQKARTNYYLSQGLILSGLGLSSSEPVTEGQTLTYIDNLVVWVTAQDDKVCWKYCQPLSGRTFEVFQSPIPPHDTHPNCRCMLRHISKKRTVILD